VPPSQAEGEGGGGGGGFWPGQGKEEAVAALVGTAGGVGRSG